MHGEDIDLQDKADPQDKKLKWYAYQLDIAIMYHYPLENLYLLFAGYSNLSPR